MAYKAMAHSWCKKICGDFYSVVGLPIAETARALEKFKNNKSSCEQK